MLFVQEISAMARFEKQRTGNHDDEDKTYDSKYAPHTHAQLAIGIHSLFLSVEDEQSGRGIRADTCNSRLCMYMMRFLQFDSAFVGMTNLSAAPSATPVTAIFQTG